MPPMMVRPCMGTAGSPVAGVGEVEQAEVGADAAGVAGEVDVPERVGGLGGLLHDVDLGAGGELAEGAGVQAKMAFCAA